ncbi:IclR family transcriptional regulator [Rhodococcus sp. 06-235-1A]|nr:IclR family transcriptional regulator [Rhodococcus sp. 06-235-1A]
MTVAVRTPRFAEVSGHEPRAVQKALALLEAVAHIGPGASAKEIAQATGVAPATAYRLLNLLVADGYLVRIDDLSGFALGRRTRELAGPDPGHDPDSIRRDVLDSLRSHIRFGVYLASYEGGRISLVDRDPDHDLVAESAILTHPHASAIGKMMLARRSEILPTGKLRVFTSHTIADSDALSLELTRVRTSDLATETDEMRIGRSAIAVPLRDELGSVSGCLAAIGRTGRLRTDDSDLIDLLRASAGRLRP